MIGTAGAQPGPDRHRGDLVARRRRARPAPITLSATVRNSGPPPPAATTVNFNLGGTVVGTAHGRRPRRRRLDHRHRVNAGTRADGQLHRRRGGRPGQHGRRAERRPTTASPRPRQLVVDRGARPGPAGPRHHLEPGQPGGRRGGHLHRRGAATAAPPRRGAPRSPGWSVGGTTLNSNTASIAAGATVTVADQRHAGPPPAAAPPSPPPPTRRTSSPRPTRTTTRSRSRSWSGAAPRCRTSSTRRRPARYQGTLLTADPLRTFGHTNFATESSGRKSVRLNSTGPVRRVHLDQPGQLDRGAQLDPGRAERRRPGGDASASTSTTSSSRS